ncbi:NACHT domain-containing protein [Maritimibacter alkaliphilus]|uniref:NACHT domain-containing protein n=1 Tax=Maritimibacter alkaliphilus TaxID=404236 RepID=UPI001C93CBAC|nr:NACHT domain-containing protein [Maritimibacter alkaliphilus]MBY6088761.1 NACHT domain-containing protein [Maritimibacter alkaliphilus]
MPLGTTVSALLLSIGANLITPAFESVKGKITDPIQQLLIRSKLETLSASAFMKMESYLRNEVRGDFADEKISRLVKEAEVVTLRIAEDKRAIVEANRDADRLVSTYIERNGYPETIREDGTTTAFLHLLTLTVSMTIEIPGLLQDWEKDSWSISFEKLDELAVSLAHQTERVLKVSENVATLSDGKLTIDKAMVSLKNALMQAKARNQIEMSGLSPAQAASAQLRSIFVAPELETLKDDSSPHEERLLSSEEQILSEVAQANSVTRITGPAGAGKTTLLRWIEQHYWTLSTRIAVRCELRTISAADQLPSLLDLFVSCIPVGMRGTLSNDDFSRWLNAGRCILIFDGFDEVSQKRRDEILEWIRGCVAGSDSGNTFIVSSRALTTDHLSDESWAISGWKVPRAWGVLGFDAQRVEKYISNWQEHMLNPIEREALLDSDRPKELAKTFIEAETIRELTSNPLLLSTLMLVHRFQGKKLPKNRSDLYKVYIDGMLGPWYEKKASSRKDFYLESDQMRRFLKLLAIEMQEREVPSLPEGVAGRIISRNKGAVRFSGPKILEHMLERTGLLVGPGDYQFAHKSIGEFLVAEAILSESFRNKAGDRVDRLHLLNHASEDSWRVVLFLWIGLVPSLKDLKAFCYSLIRSGYIQIAASVIEERYEDFTLDHKEDLAELLMEICTFKADKVAAMMDSLTMGRYVNETSLPESYRARFEIESIGCLKISGLAHFEHEFVLNAIRDKIIKPEMFADGPGDNSFYYELWQSWIRTGVDLPTLIRLSPSCLSRVQALSCIARRRGLVKLESSLTSNVRDVLFVPHIIDSVHDQIAMGRFVRNRDAELGLNIDIIEGYLDINPISSWPDDWIPPKFGSNVGLIEWENDEAWAKCTRTTPPRSMKILNEYRERARELCKRSEVTGESSSVNSIWTLETEDSLFEFVSKDIMERGDLGSDHR